MITSHHQHSLSWHKSLLCSWGNQSKMEMGVWLGWGFELVDGGWRRGDWCSPHGKGFRPPKSPGLLQITLMAHMGIYTCARLVPCYFRWTGRCSNSVLCNSREVHQCQNILKQWVLPVYGIRGLVVPIHLVLHIGIADVPAAKLGKRAPGETMHETMQKRCMRNSRVANL